MSMGPGKYDDACTAALVSTKARMVLLIVVDGEHGTGFSVNSLDPQIVAAVPTLLRQMADQIEGVN